MFQAFALIANLVISILMRPKPPKPSVAAHDTNSIPTASADRVVPVLFGTMTIKGANVVWYGDLYTKVLKKKGSKGK